MRPGTGFVRAPRTVFAQMPMSDRVPELSLPTQRLREPRAAHPHQRQSLRVGTSARNHLLSRWSSRGGILLPHIEHTEQACECMSEPRRTQQEVADATCISPWGKGVGHVRDAHPDLGVPC